METIDDFFIRENRVEGVISENDYKQTELVIRSMKAIARMTYKSIYVIDYYRKNFLYVSDNPIFLCGYSPDEVKDMGYKFYQNQVPPKELSMLLEINKAGFELYNATPVEERMHLFISYDFHIADGGHLKLINHKLTPIVLTDKGNIWLAVCIVSLSSNKEAGNIEARIDGKPDYWTYSIKDHHWEKRLDVKLNKREKEILHLSAQGLSENAIGAKTNTSLSTIKFHKKNLFKKLKIRNISAAINKASNQKLI